MGIRLSGLAKTWILDLDGTIVVHNGYKYGKECLLPGVKEFFSTLKESDYVIILTAREEKYREETERFLAEQGIRYHTILFGMPYGERILFNDRKKSGLDMAYAINQDRDVGIVDQFQIDPQL